MEFRCALSSRLVVLLFVANWSSADPWNLSTIETYLASVDPSGLPLPVSLCRSLSSEEKNRRKLGPVGPKDTNHRHLQSLIRLDATISLAPRWRYSCKANVECGSSACPQGTRAFDKLPCTDASGPLPGRQQPLPFRNFRICPSFILRALGPVPLFCAQYRRQASPSDKMSTPALQSKEDASLETKELPLQHHGDIDIDDDADPRTPYIDGYTKSDRKDMRRMGKTQELMRNFRRLSAFSFTVMLTATWEYILMYATDDRYGCPLANPAIQSKLARSRQRRLSGPMVEFLMDVYWIWHDHDIAC